MTWREQFEGLGAAVGAASKAFRNLTRGHRGPKTTLSPGDVAPDFSLPGSDGRTYQLSDYRDRAPVVLAWFPKAFTSGCTTECRSMGASVGALDAQGAVYFGVSTDDPATNRRFAASLGIGFPILSDADGRVGRAFGVVGATGLASRWTFYIAPTGRIAAIDRAVRVGSHGRDIAARLAELNLRAF